MADEARAQPARRGDLNALADTELLAMVQTLPREDARHAGACEVLISRYRKLVRSCVRPYRGSPESAEELMQAGYLGLLKAINNFDLSAGNDLWAYARPCISGEIKRHFRDKRWQVHVRRPAKELLLELRAAAEELTHQLGRAPDESELARHLGVADSELAEARRADIMFHSYSLDRPGSGFPGQDPPPLAETLGEDDHDLEHVIDMQAVYAHWNELPAREQLVLNLRFYGNLTQAQIGDRLGISQMHVSRLLARALGYLRERLLAEDGETAAPAPLRSAVRPGIPAIPIVIVGTQDGRSLGNDTSSYKDALAGGACRPLKFAAIEGTATFQAPGGSIDTASFGDDLNERDESYRLRPVLTPQPAAAVPEPDVARPGPFTLAATADGSKLAHPLHRRRRPSCPGPYFRGGRPMRPLPRSAS